MGLVLSFPDLPEREMNLPTDGEGAGALDPLWTVMTEVAERHEAALGQLYDLTVGKVFAVASMIMGSAADAEEVTCDVYAQVWQNATRYETGRGSVMAWLLTICRSRALDALRRRRVISRTHESSADHISGGVSESPDDLLECVERGSAVHQALAQLSPVRRHLLVLAYFRDLSHEEIAATVQMPLGTVKSHIRRGLRTLRQSLEGTRP